MSAQKLFDEILPILYTIKEDESKLQEILAFLKTKIGIESDELQDEHEKEWVDLLSDGNVPQTNTEEIAGFYDDDGNKIDPDSVPVTTVCMSCKVHWIDDPEENLLCRIKRFEHRNDKDFKCDAFEKN